MKPLNEPRKDLCRLPPPWVGTVESKVVECMVERSPGTQELLLSAGVSDVHVTQVVLISFCRWYYLYNLYQSKR